MSVYDKKIKPQFEYIKRQLENGASEKQVAEAIGVGYSTFRWYRDKEAAFSALIKSVDRTNLIEDLKSALITKAKGFVNVQKRAVKVKEVIYENGKRLKEIEKVVFYDEETYYPPDTTAIFGALNIYDKDYIKDKANYILKKEELELKKQQMENENF